MRSRPDILVLGGGGVLGAGWMSGLLAGLEDGAGIDLRRCEYFVGTSAGAIVAVRLAAGLPPRRPEPVAGESPVEPAADRAPDTSADTAPKPPARLRPATAASPIAGLIGAVGDLTSPLAAPWLRLGATLTEPVAARSRAIALRVIPQGTDVHRELHAELEPYRARFDGRLRIACVEVERGRRVVFGAPGSPPATPVEAVAASCSIPWRHAPVEIGGRRYVDGGVWSPINLDAAPAGRGARILCLSPIASVHGPLTAAIRAPSRAIVELELIAARGRGVEIELITPDQGSAGAIGRDPMAREPAARVVAAGYAQGLALAAAD